MWKNTIHVPVFKKNKTELGDRCLEFKCFMDFWISVQTHLNNKTNTILTMISYTE